MEIQIGQTVELTVVENDIMVTEIPGHGLVSVTIDGTGDVVSAWPENLKIINRTPAQVGATDASESEPAAKSEPAGTSEPTAQ